MSLPPESREEAIARLNRSASDLEARTAPPLSHEAAGQAAAGQAEEVLGTQRRLEPDEVGAEQPADHLLPLRQLHEQLTGRERDVNRFSIKRDWLFASLFLFTPLLL